MVPVRMYCTRNCGYCVRAEKLLGKKGVTPDSIEKIRVDENPGKRAEMVEATGRRTVPQIFIGDRYIGGFDELAELDVTGELEDLLHG